MFCDGTRRVRVRHWHRNCAKLTCMHPGSGLFMTNPEIEYVTKDYFKSN